MIFIAIFEFGCIAFVTSHFHRIYHLYPVFVYIQRPYYDYVLLMYYYCK